MIQYVYPCLQFTCSVSFFSNIKTPSKHGYEFSEPPEMPGGRVGVDVLDVIVRLHVVPIVHITKDLVVRFTIFRST